MGDLIYLAERAADRSRPTANSAAFFFALDCPLSYLVAERVERTLGHIDWVPVIGLTELDGSQRVDAESKSRMDARFEVAQALASALEFPLQKPENYPMPSRRAARVAVFAEEQGGPDCTRRYSLAILRLAFCGGFNINDRNVIGDAAAAAGLDPRAALRATRDPRYDTHLDATTLGLMRRGAPSVPAIRMGDAWFGGADPLLSITA